MQKKLSKQFPLHPRRHHHVACALIECRNRILAAQRSEDMSLPLKWEFPGGKLEPGETPSECLHRELEEELGVSVTIVRSLAPYTHDYADFTVTLYPYVCHLKGEQSFSLHEHRAVAWMSREEMLSLDWAEADLPLIADYLADCSA